MPSFYCDKDTVIDPAYVDLSTFSKHYDYDLLGRSVHWKKWFWKDMLHYFRLFLDDYPGLITACTFGCIFVLLTIFAATEQCAQVVRYIFNSWYADRELKYEQKQLEERKKYMQRKDHDRFAAVHCRATANKLGVASVMQPTPRDLPDFEAVRFVFPQPWLVEKNHKALKKVEFDPIWDELVEGELEDALTLAMREKRLITRQPLSLPARIMAKQVLAKGEEKLPSKPIITPEMRLVQGWEELYRQRIREATKENYRWWRTQDKTLPVEARETTEKLQPIVAQVRKTATVTSQPEEDQLPDLKRLPHDGVHADGTRPPKDEALVLSGIRGGPEIISHPADLDESAMLRELEEIEQAQVARVKRTSRQKSGCKEKRKASSQEHGRRGS
ncbi:hypothetical protein PHET_05036 [Paragonimus heterotremus]|uniref:Uncharacterized protein n=1 Tax=Paragonimus heterotremus TaxID=100268 RepID=A0A8J4WIW2_9TREM|nr:hypothetical protein PHET_05036 [Paragonimus heterotremus]